MPATQNEVLLNTHLSQALLYLNKDNFEGFVESMLSLGQWIQSEFKINHYKKQSARLEAELSKLDLSALRQLNAQQAFAFNIFENSWQESSYSRMKTLHFTAHKTATAEANSCLFIKIEEPPYWQVIPVDAEGKKQKALDLSKFDDAAVIAGQLPVSLLDKAPKDYTPEEEALVVRLQRALKRAREETLDQTGLTSKAVLAKETRHQIKLGKETFKFFFKDQMEKTEAAELALLFQENEPTSEEINHFKAETYVVIPPKLGVSGRVFFYKNRFSKKEEIEDEILKDLLKEDQLSLWLYRKKDEQDQASKNDNQVFRERAEKDFREKMHFYILDYHQRSLDEKARYAIRSYLRPSQKITRVIGNILAAITAVAYGGVELVATMLGFFVAAGIIWSNPLLALGGVLLLAGAIILPFPSTWANWKVFSTYVPEFFDKIGEEYSEINGTGKKALFWGLSLFAFATGIAAGGLAYTATIALPLMLGLGAISAIFPPIGIFLAAAILITQTCMLVRNFANILRKEDSWAAFKAPFLRVNKILNDSNAGWTRQLLTWGMVIGLAVLSVLGLAMSCFTSTRSVGKFFIDQMETAPEKALMLGVFIGAIGSFLSRVYFTLNSAISSALIFSKRVGRGNTEEFFSKDYEDYQVFRINEDLAPEQVAAKVKPEQFAANDKIIVLVGSDKDQITEKPKSKFRSFFGKEKERQVKTRDQKAYFIVNNKIVNTEKGVLAVDVNLIGSKEKGLVKEKEGLIAKTEDNKDCLNAVTQKAVTSGTAELLATETKPLPISAKKKGAIIVDSTLAGGFYAQNMLSLAQKTPEEMQHEPDIGISGLAAGPTAVLATVAFIAAGARYVGIDCAHIDTPEDPYAASRAKAALKRGESNLTYYLDRNPNSVFAAGRETNWGIRDENDNGSTRELVLSR